MKKLLFLIPIPFGIGCAEPEVNTPIDDTVDLEVGDIESQFYGKWEMQEALIAFLNEDGEVDTIPTTVNAGEVTEVYYVDGNHDPLVVSVDMNYRFFDNGMTMGNRHIVAGDDEFHEMDTSQWWLDEEYFNMGSPTVRILSYYEFYEDDVLFLDWDRDNPEFMDHSCIWTLLLRRTERY